MTDTKPDLKNTLEEFEEQHDRLAALKEQVKKEQEIYDHYRQVLVPEALEAHGILVDGKGSCTTPGGRKVYIATDIRAYIRKEDEEKAYDAIREAGFGELIREAIHPSTLTAWAKQQLENAESIPAGVNIFSQDKAVLRKN